MSTPGQERRVLKAKTGWLGTFGNQLHAFVRAKWWLLVLLAIVIVSFITDMAILNVYEISYGIDGPYYDIQVRYIIRTGFPDTNDPPLVYYYLLPFVLAAGNSFLGIKIGMAAISSAIAIPAYLLTDMFTGKAMSRWSKVPALSSAVLMTFNPYYMRMIEDFMQNLVGVFFLLWLFYFLVKWLEDPGTWKVNGVLTFAMLLCNVLTHVSTGGIAIILFLGLFLFSFLVKVIKYRKFPKFEVLMFSVLIGLAIAVLIPLILVFPEIFTNFQGRISSFLGTVGDAMPQQASSLVLITAPVMLGLAAVVVYLFKKVVTRSPQPRGGHLVDKKVYMAWILATLVALFLFLIMVPSTWQSRFEYHAFIPIGLVIPFGLIALEFVLHKRQSGTMAQRKAIVVVIAAIFIFSSVYSSTRVVPGMGPSITDNQYHELVYIKANYIPGVIDPSGTMAVNITGNQALYWVWYVLDMETVGIGAIKGNETGPVYSIVELKNERSPFNPNTALPWNPLLPYMIPFIELLMPRGPPGPPPSPAPGSGPVYAPPTLVFTGTYYGILLLIP